MGKGRKLTVEERLELQEAKIQAVADGLNAILVDFAKIDAAEEVRKERPWDASNIKWEKAEGARGFYEKAKPQSGPDFKALLQDLKDHDGKLTRDGWFIWVFTDACTIGRKRRS